MSKQTIWLIFAGLTALLAVPVMYIGLQEGRNTLVIVGFALFTLGMMVTPIIRLISTWR